MGLYPSLIEGEVTMRQREATQAMTGMVVAALGLIALAAGLSRSPLHPDVLTLPGWQAATIEGFVLLTAGLFVSAFSFGKVPDPVPSVTATVAFASRHVAATEPILERAARTPPPIAEVRPERPVQPMDPQALALFRLDEEIRDLTRRINKAGVMLATGQLSEEGYAHYVEDLKKQRGSLEASRIRLQMAKRP